MKTPHIYFLIAFTFIFGLTIGYLSGRHDSKLISPEPCTTIHAITMPENAYNQLLGADRIMVKILK